jgi:hypothetical protein
LALVGLDFAAQDADFIGGDLGFNLTTRIDNYGITGIGRARNFTP